MPRTRKRHNQAGRAAPFPRRRAAWPVWALYLAVAAGLSPGAVNVLGPADQGVTHDASDAPQAFAEQTWTLGSTEAGGSTVQLSCGPFVHASGASLKADCKLGLRVLTAAPSSGWAALVPADQTNIAASDNTAAVSARSTGSGDGTVGLTVTFLNSDFSTLAAGDYTVTVTGTITAN